MSQGASGGGGIQRLQSQDNSIKGQSQSKQQKMGNREENSQEFTRRVARIKAEGRRREEGMEVGLTVLVGKGKRGILKEEGGVIASRPITERGLHTTKAFLSNHLPCTLSSTDLSETGRVSSISVCGISEKYQTYYDHLDRNRDTC